MQTNFMGRDGFQWFTGVVEDRADPLKVGRVRVRAVGYHTQDLNILPTADLPWATVMQPTTSPAVSGLGTHTFLVEGTWVVGFWRDLDCQEPIILGSLPGIPTAQPDTTLGFNDPTGTYPSATNVSDVNSLARGTQTHTYTPDTVISEPADPYGSVYPKNHVYATESGHTKEYDDTTGKERIKEKHKSGTFYEMHPNGDMVTRIVNNNYEIVAGNESVHISGSVTLNIDTNCTTNITGNWDVNVAGNITIDGNTINLNSGTKGAAREGDVVSDVDPIGDGVISGKSSTVFIGG